MEDLSPSSLKTILHSKRANLYYLEHCRVQVNGGRVEYVTEEGKRSAYWNIPIANTTSLLLGTGTSITQAAVRELAKAGVAIGFCGGGGTPLFAAADGERDIAWFTSQSEYRPTEYLQKWVGFWFDDERRLEAATRFQRVRIARIRGRWTGSALTKAGFAVNGVRLESVLDEFESALTAAASPTDVLSLEARTTKALYGLAARAVDYGRFVRAKRGTGTDAANGFLDHGNYLTYGLAATAVWVLGLPPGLAVLHGKTRRGGLVFDVADLVKDAVVLPQAFVSAAAGDDEQAFRHACLSALRDADALDIMIDALKDVAEVLGS